MMVTCRGCPGSVADVKIEFGRAAWGPALAPTSDLRSRGGRRFGRLHVCDASMEARGDRGTPP